VARVDWVGTSTHDARALLADRGDGDDEPGGNPAAAFIFDYLMRNNVGGEAPAGDVLKAGKAAGFSDNDLKHARSRSRAPRIVYRDPDAPSRTVIGHRRPDRTMVNEER